MKNLALKLTMLVDISIVLLGAHSIETVRSVTNKTLVRLIRMVDLTPGDNLLLTRSSTSRRPPTMPALDTLLALLSSAEHTVSWEGLLQQLLVLAAALPVVGEELALAAAAEDLAVLEDRTGAAWDLAEDADALLLGLVEVVPSLAGSASVGVELVAVRRLSAVLDLEVADALPVFPADGGDQLSVSASGAPSVLTVGIAVVAVVLGALSVGLRVLLLLLWVVLLAVISRLGVVLLLSFFWLICWLL